jgi:hypothetical protein
MNSFIVIVPLEDCPVSLDTFLNWVEYKLRYLQENENVQDYLGEWINNWVVTPFKEY